VNRTSFASILASSAIVLSLTQMVRADDTGPNGPSGANGQPLTTIVVTATPLPGVTIDADKIPGNVQVLSAADISRKGSASLTDAMNSQLGSININDNLDDAFQPDLLYRGFEASPVLGTPQGLAVYQNGVRINEAFGNTVDWDLFPDIAVNNVQLVSSSPVYGLNALGGAVTVGMKNGFSYQGADIEAYGGSWGTHSVEAQFGGNSGMLGFYIAARGLDSAGWRMFNDDVVRQMYTALTLRGDRGSLELTYTGDHNALNGQGAAPVQELAVSRSLVFTGPQQYLDHLNFLTLNGNYKLTDNWSVQSVVYYRQFSQYVSNGNTTDFTSCTVAPYLGDLCQGDGLTPATNAAGQPLPDISQNGAYFIGENDFESIESYGRGITLQTTDTDSIAGHSNQFTAGASLDYALVNFMSGTQVGVLNSQLTVLPSNVYVFTPALTKNLGIYGTDTFDVTSALSVTASVRYNVADIDLEDRLGTNLTGNNTYTHVNPALGATYKLTPAVTAYAGFSQNTRTPTASEIECSNPLQPCLLPSNLAGDPPTLKQVVSHTYEAGLRGTFNGAAPGNGSLSWNLSVFRTKLHDDIYGIATSVSSGFFANIGDTRRQGAELGVKYETTQWSAYFNYSYVDATFESPLLLPSPSNPYQIPPGNIEVEPGDHLPGIPQHRVKLGADYKVLPVWNVGATITYASSQYYYGDESNQLGPMPGYTVVGLHTSVQATRNIQLFARIENLFDAKYANYGILSDPTGIGAPGIPPLGYTNGPGVDNRFQSPSNPFAIYAGFKITF
jgi:iron complex outermembrane recepter protein